MPSPFSTDRAELCGHKVTRCCCVSCEAHEARRAHDHALKMIKEREGKAKMAQTLADAKPKGAERDRFLKEAKRAQQELADWRASAAATKEWVENVEPRVKEICDATEETDLAGEFEQSAAEYEYDLQLIWTQAKAKPGDGYQDIFSPADPACHASSAAFDPTKVPADLKSAVRDAYGTQIFIKADTTDTRLPSEAVGEKAGVPATKAYGNALHPEFKVPVGQRVRGARERTQTSTLSGVEEGLDKLGIAGSSSATTQSAELTDKGRWALFGKLSGQFYMLLASHYYTAAVQKKKNQQALRGAEGQATDAETTPASDSASQEKGAYMAPPVGEPTFEGFTDWLVDLKKSYKRFNLEVMKPWQQARTTRQSLKGQLQNWQAPENFDDGTLRGVKPSKFYRQDLPLFHDDLNLPRPAK